MCEARLAQSVEHETLNLRVVGSSPTLGALQFYRHLCFLDYTYFSERKLKFRKHFGDFHWRAHPIKSDGCRYQ